LIRAAGGTAKSGILPLKQFGRVLKAAARTTARCASTRSSLY